MFAVVGELLVCNSLTNTTCLFFHSEMFNISSNEVWWMIGPKTIFTIVLFLSVITLFEFVRAQSPRPFCGLLIGIFIMFSALSAFIGHGIYELVAIIVSNTQSWFCSNFSITLVALCISCCFIVFPSGTS